MGTLLSDLRLACRMLLRSPSFTLVLAITLALGIGGSCAIFSVVNTVLLRPLPYKDPDRLVRLFERYLRLGSPVGVSPANFADWRDQNRVFGKQIAAFRMQDFRVTGTGEPTLVRGASVSAILPRLLGVEPIRGRTFAAEEDRTGAGRVALLGQAYWRRAFGASPAVLGQSLTINGEPYTVIGVMPESFDFPDRAELWVPLALTPEVWSRRGGRFLDVVARLDKGVTQERATQEMSALARRLAEQYPDANAGMGIALDSLRDEMVGDVRRALVILFGAVSVVLLIACANVATLLLARIAGRRHESAVRTALGASRVRLIRQLLTEFVLLALVGGALGLVLARVGIDWMLAMKPAGITQIRDVALDGQVVGFALLLSLLTGLLFGLVPAFYASQQESGLLLGQRGDKLTTRARRLQSLFVVGEVALALVLLIGGGLMSRSFERLYDVNPGFDGKNVFALSLALPKQGYPGRPQQAVFFDRLIERVRALPGAELVGAATAVPLTRSGDAFDFSIAGRPPARTGEELIAAYEAVSADYFSILRVPLRQGRGFTSHDDSHAPAVCIVNETLARRFWPGGSPLGARLEIGDRGPNPREIVGVVADVKRRELAAETPPEIYVPYRQAAAADMTLFVRSRAAAASLAAALRHEVWAVDKNLPISRAATMEQIIAESVSQRRFNTLLLVAFAMVAVTLAAIGLYGILWYTVNTRRQEISIRMALGARVGDVRWLVLKQGLALVLLGLAIGLPGALLLTRLLSHLLFGISATDPLTFAGVCLGLLLVALVACYVPVAKASRVDPMTAMRIS